MELNLKNITFSTYGSYIGFREKDNKLTLNSLRGKSKGNTVSMILGFGSPYSINADYNELTMANDDSTAKICFMNEEEVIIKVNSNEFYIDTTPKYNFEYNYLLGKENNKSILVNSYKNLTKYLIKVVNGNMSLEQQVMYETTGQNTESNNNSIIKFSSKEEFYIVIKEVSTNGSKFSQNELKPYDEYVQFQKKQFNNFVNKLPRIEEQRKEAIYLAAYILYSSTVSPQGLLKQYATYASNGDFPSIYSWDNCIISFGLSLIDRDLSLNQIKVFLDVQDEYGQIPGSVSDSSIRWNFSKPPIQGWTLNKLKDNLNLSKEEKLKLYDMTKKLTEYYFIYKDSDEDGICEYHHGNDSGQDNSTAFRNQLVVDSPDLQAFLIESYVFLKNINEELQIEEMDYQKIIDDLVSNFVKYYWDGNDMNVYETFNKNKVSTEGIIKYMGILLENKLPIEVKQFLIDKVSSSDYLTEYGIATESVNSKEYVSDAYWRGPIWAPTTILLYESFKGMKEEKIAKEIATKYCDMIEKDMTFAENFDAQKGNGLRDHNFCWTASAYLYLQNEL